jgi:hypothetical protein
MNHFDSIGQIVGALEFGILVAVVSVVSTAIARRLNRRYAIKAWLQRKLPGVSFNRIALALLIVLMFFSCSVIGFTIVRRMFKPRNPLPEALYINHDP